MANAMQFPRYAGRCRKFEETKNLICYICPDSIEHHRKVNWYKHSRDPQHLLMIEQFNKSFCETKFLVICKHCKKSFGKRETATHAISHQLLPWYKPQNIYIIFLTNFIAQIEKQYYCHLCEHLFSHWHDAFNHVDDLKHQRLQKNKTHEDMHEEISRCAEYAESLINHSVFPKKSLNFECMICHTHFSRYKNFNDHINGKSHKSREGLFVKSLENETAIISTSASVHERKKRSRRRFRGSRGHTPKSSNVKNSSPSSSSKTGTLANAITSKVSVKSKLLPNKIVTPQRQFTRVIPESTDKSLKSTCPICKEQVHNGVYLHAHLTSHYWKRFHQQNSPEKDQLNMHAGGDFQNELMNKVTKTRKDIINTRNNLLTNENKDNSLVIPFKGTSRLKFFEILNKQLEPKIIPEIHEPFIIDESTIAHTASTDIINSETSMRKSSPKFSENGKRIRPDIQRRGLNCNYIYDIDNKQLENIKFGIMSSFTNSKSTIYCMICREIVEKSVENMHEHLCSIQHDNYLKEIQRDHLSFATFPNSFSDLQLAMQFIEETSDLFVKCWACNETIENLTHTLKWHIEKDSHKDNCNELSKNSGILFESIKTRMFRDWLNVRYYWCVLCSTRFTSETCFTQHLDSSKHKKKDEKYKQFEDVIYDFCATCATLWYGFRCTSGYHNQCKMHKYLLKDHFYHVTELPKKAMKLLVNPEQMCDEISVEINRNIEDDKLKVQILVNDLREVAQEKFPNAKLHPFGSRITGLSSKNSDLDVFVDCKNMYFKGDPSSNKILVYLKAVENALKSHSETWKINRTITENVRIPIIKTYHKCTGIECDISFTNGLAAENTKLIKSYIEINPLCRKLVIFMKKWMEECDLCGCNGLTSYAVTWMVIYYLQTENILPSVAKLIELKGKSNVIAGWETGVTNNVNVSWGEFNFIQLVKGFFITYAQFDYRHEVICPLMGRPIKKVSFEMCDLPIAMDPYKKYLSKQKESNKFRIDSAFCIQDPFELCNNITVRLKKFLVHRLKFFSCISAQVLHNHF